MTERKHLSTRTLQNVVLLMLALGTFALGYSTFVLLTKVGIFWFLVIFPILETLLVYAVTRPLERKGY